MLFSRESAQEISSCRSWQTGCGRCGCPSMCPKTSWPLSWTYGNPASTAMRITSASPPPRCFRYADHLDVSLDYLYGRPDDPRCKMYSNKPDLGKLHPEMNKFIEMCFDPKSPMNKRLKKALVQMQAETK